MLINIREYSNTIFIIDGTDYWLGGLDANKDKQLQWMTGMSIERGQMLT